MTRREAIKVLERLKIASKACGSTSDDRTYDKAVEALDIALAVLRGPTREQVEKMRGEWVNWEDGVCCSICETERPTKSGTIKFSSRLMRFCPYCGSPMTDEAVGITLRRLEALKDGTTD